LTLTSRKVAEREVWLALLECVNRTGHLTVISARARCDPIVVHAQRSEAGEWADGGGSRALQRGRGVRRCGAELRELGPLLPARELSSRNQFSGSHEALSVTAEPNN
jgi:hypothetical protein